MRTLDIGAGVGQVELGRSVAGVAWWVCRHSEARSFISAASNLKTASPSPQSKVRIRDARDCGAASPSFNS